MSLEDKIKALPNSAGIYQFFDKNGKLLYIGKAKSLIKRVKSYFRFTPYLAPSNRLSKRIERMILQTVELNYIVVDSENSALILENSLIKQLKPKYNILLRDDKTYPYIYINLNEPFPRFESTRVVVAKNARGVKYFGPFPLSKNDILEALYDTFALVQQKSCLRGKKACLYFQMKRCLAPCEGLVDAQSYRKVVDEAMDALLHKHKLIEALEAKMQTLSAELRFEEALKLRDRVASIKKSDLKTSVDLASKESLDIFAIESGVKSVAVVRLFIRDGKLISSNATLLNQDEAHESDRAQIYASALLSFYKADMPMVSSRVLVAHDITNRALLADFLTKQYGKKIEVVYPKIGEKARLREIAIINAKEALKRAKSDTILDDVKALFKLENTPFRIEAFDNSHLMQKAPVGAMVVYAEGKFQRANYRRYQLEAKDEYAQMRQMLTRRVESFDKNSPPELWVIDGGKALLDLAYSILKSVGVDIDVVAIAKEKIDAKAHRAKGKANDTIYTKEATFRLKSEDKRLQFIQKIRDESHRFAIKYHREKKLALDKSISLLEIEGVSKQKVHRLLSMFGTFEAIRVQEDENLLQVLNKKDLYSFKKFFEDKQI